MASTPGLVLAILPEILLAVLASSVLILDLVWKPERRAVLGWFAAIGVAVIMVIAAFAVKPGDSVLVWGGMLRFDRAGYLFSILFMLGAALTCLFAANVPNLMLKGEFYALILVSTIGMSFMSKASDLVMLFLAIETTSIPLYVLAGFVLRDKRSVEAGVKYLIYGSMATAILAYGFSLLYGFSGTTQLTELPAKLTSANLGGGLYTLLIVLVLVGFSFKISAFPFHFWAPDVYQGSQSTVSGFLSTASKAAGFAAMMRVLGLVFPDQSHIWSIVLAVVATASMLIGNYLALAQTSVKRMLAYSSIAQAGYMLIGVVAGTEFGFQATIYYLTAYLVTNLAAFGLVSWAEQKFGSDDYSAFSGIARKYSAFGIALIIALLSLAGIPPFAGFFGKVLVFSAAIEQGWVWLALVGIFNAIVGLFYYLNLLKIAYVDELKAAETETGTMPSWKTAVLISLASVLLIGVWFSPWFEAARNAAASLLGS